MNIYYKCISVGRVKLFILKINYYPELNIIDNNEIDDCKWFNIKHLYNCNNDEFITFNSPLRTLIKKKLL